MKVIPSTEVTDDSVPLGTVRSALLKPVTASEKVKVTALVWPTAAMIVGD